MNPDRFSAIKCLISTLAIGSLFALFMALCDRAEAKQIQHVQREARYAR